MTARCRPCVRQTAGTDTGHSSLDASIFQGCILISHGCRTFCHLPDDTRTSYFTRLSLLLFLSLYFCFFISYSSVFYRHPLLLLHSAPNREGQLRAMELASQSNIQAFLDAAVALEELLRLGIARVVHNVLGRAVLGNLAAAQQHDAVCRIMGKAHLMCRHEYRGALLLEL